MAYRSREQIVAEILQAASQQASKTRLMYGARLSYFQFRSYQQELMSMGLIEHDNSNKSYNTTAKGHDFLQHFNKLCSIVQS